MAITFNDVDDLTEFALEYAGLGQMIIEQMETLAGGERLPSDQLSQDAVEHYIIPFLYNANDRGIVFPGLEPDASDNFDYLLSPRLDSFTVTVTVKTPAEDEYDAIAIESRIRNALETEGLNLYSDLQVVKLA